MVQFLYTSDYDDLKPAPLDIQPGIYNLPNSVMRQPTSQGSTNSSPATQDVSCEANKDHYQNAAANLILHVKLYIIGDKYDIQVLKDLSVIKYSKLAPGKWDSKHFLGSITLLYDNTVEAYKALKRVVPQLLQKHVHELLKEAEFLEILNNYPEVSIDMLTHGAFFATNGYDRFIFHCMTCAEACRCISCRELVFWKKSAFQEGEKRIHCSNPDCGAIFSETQVTTQVECPGNTFSCVVKHMDKPF